MVWYGMVCTTLPNSMVPSLLSASFISYPGCIISSSEVATPSQASTRRTLGDPLKVCASIPLDPLQCEVPLNFHQETAYKRTFPGSRSSLSLSKRLQISRRTFVRLTDCRMQPTLEDTGVSKNSVRKLRKLRKLFIQNQLNIKQISWNCSNGYLSFFCIITRKT